MENTNNQIGFSYIEYSAEFHMKYKHLFVDRVYDHECVNKCPLIITWAEAGMRIDEESGKCLAVATKTPFYPDKYKLSQDVFENMLQAFIIYPGTDADTNELRLDFAKALLES